LGIGLAFKDLLFMVLKSYEGKIFSWVSAGLWIFVSSFLWSPSRDGIEGIFALTIFIPMLAILFNRKPTLSAYGGVFTGAALLYATWSVLSGIWGADLGFLLLQWLVLVIWLVGSAWVVQNKLVDWDKFLTVLLTIGAVTAVVNIAAFYWSNPWGARLEGITAARAATLVGQVYGLVALIGILLSWRARNLVSSIGFSLISTPAIIALLLSQSRGPLIALAVALLIGAVWIRPSWKIISMHLVAALALLFAIGVSLQLDTIEALLFQRGTSFRDGIWLDVLQKMQQEPGTFLWGIGMSGSTDINTALGEYHHAHNAWLDTLYRTGVIGLGLALVHLGLLMFGAFRTRELAPLTLWLIYGCGCLFVDSRTLFWEIDVKWLLYWVPAALLGASLIRQQHAAVVEGKL